jgi:hypothetical protein
MPLLTTAEQFGFGENLQSEITSMIDRRAGEESVKNPAFRTFSNDMSPNEFETFCADELRRVGWNAYVTKRSRDQGVDVVADKNGVRVVVQCKLYSRPVGNKAVQEIAAARTHEQAEYAVVASNNKYTPDAEQLASTTKVLLLHYTDLCRLEDIIDLKSKALKSVWYYADGDGQIGPFTIEELTQTLGTFAHPQQTFVWTTGFADWKLAKDIPELKSQSHFKSQRARVI